MTDTPTPSVTFEQDPWGTWTATVKSTKKPKPTTPKK